MERLSSHLDTHGDQLIDLRALARRSESRIVALSDQLSRSQADLESTSARFSELAREIPADVAGLSGQLSRILNAATAEADSIRAEACRFAETVRVEAEDRAARILKEAQLERDSATALRSDLEAHSKQMRADFDRLREQAALNAADIVREAKDTAEAMLGRVHRDIEAQLSVAQTKLDELIGVRANIAAQLRDFYDKFNQLDGPLGSIDRIPAVVVVSDSSEFRPSHDADAPIEVELTHETFRAPG